MSEMTQVLIVGAGPTGLTVALELSRMGVPVRLIDKRAEPSTTSRALAVQARTLELFQQRGLADEMLRLGNRGTAATFYGDGRRMGQVHLSEIPSRYNFILLLSQAETERILREQVARQGVQVEFSTELIAFAQPEATSSPHVTGPLRAILRHKDGALEELETAYLVSAEGAHSLVRHTLNLPFEGQSLRQSYALGDLFIDGDLPSDQLSIFLAKEGLLAAFPLADHHFRFIATDPEEHSTHAAEPSLEEMQQLYDQYSSIPGRLHDMVWSSRFRINSRMLKHLRERQVFLGGDSAHVHSPVGGQGMNTGIQDMINLGWKLALVLQGKAAPELLDTYSDERLPIIRDVVNRTETATEAFNSDSGEVHHLITHLAPLLLNHDFVQQKGTAVISEVAAHHRKSPLSATHSAPGEFQAGDRVPDLNVMTRPFDSTQQATRLYDLFNPSRFTLLQTGDSNILIDRPMWEEQFAAWHEVLSLHRVSPIHDVKARDEFERLFGVESGLFLVRPDSYFGFVGGAETGPLLMDWLQKWLPPSKSFGQASA